MTTLGREAPVGAWRVAVRGQSQREAGLAWGLGACKGACGVCDGGSTSRARKQARGGRRDR
eukprot:3935002-Rhodomonas_salina.1